MKRTFSLLSLLLAASLLLGACGNSDNQSAIATAVALTVQAQASPTPDIFASAAPPPNLTTVPTLTPAATTTEPPTVSRSYEHCASASLVSENLPDGTIFKTGEKFLKTWHIKNTSNCTWDPSYKIVFWDGDLMGGSYNYNFPQTLPPGQSANVSLWLAAPDAPGDYKGEWKLQTPDGRKFGVGTYQSPLWADIVVIAANATPTYGITSVVYELDRQPPTGCATNTWFTVTAHVSFSGPLKEVVLQFFHSDGFRSRKQKFEVKEATTLTFTNQWKFYIADAQGPKWIMLVQQHPEYVEYDKVNFTFQCN